MFAPADGGSATLSCGRQCAPTGGSAFLSNAYYRLAQRFGLDVPWDYSIASGEGPHVVAEKILADLERTLPTVVSKVALKDFIAVESEEPVGAARIVGRSFGENYAPRVAVSEFSKGQAT